MLKILPLIFASIVLGRCWNVALHFDTKTVSESWFVLTKTRSCCVPKIVQNPGLWKGLIDDRNLIAIFCWKKFFVFLKSKMHNGSAHNWHESFLIKELVFNWIMLSANHLSPFLIMKQGACQGNFLKIFEINFAQLWMFEEWTWINLHLI